MLLCVVVMDFEPLTGNNRMPNRIGENLELSPYALLVADETTLLTCDPLTQKVIVLSSLILIGLTDVAFGSLAAHKYLQSRNLVAFIPSIIVCGIVLALITTIFYAVFCKPRETNSAEAF